MVSRSLMSNIAKVFYLFMFGLLLAAQSSFASAETKLLVIDRGVPDFQKIINDLPENTDYLLLDNSGDPFKQIAHKLAIKPVDTVHIFSHAEPGVLNLSGKSINANNIHTYEKQLTNINNSLLDGADILFYGCDLAATASGQDLLLIIAAQTGTDVAASTDATGHASLGGNWNLEHTIGRVDASVMFSPAFQSEYTFTLAHFRGGSISWRAVELDNDGLIDDVEITVKTACGLGLSNSNGCRPSNLTTPNGFPTLSSPVYSDPITFGEEGSTEAYRFDETTFTANNLDPETSYLVYYGSGNRIKELKNNSEGTWKIQTTILMQDGNLPPKIDLPILYEAPLLDQNGDRADSFSFPVSAIDSNGDKVRYRLANEDELGGEGESYTNPVGISINASTGVVTWDYNALPAGTVADTGLYSAGFIAEDLDSNGDVKSKSHVDLILSLKNQKGVTFTTGDNIPESRTIIVEKGDSFEFSITGDAVDTSSLGNLKGALTEGAEGNFTFAPGNIGDTVDLDPGTYPITFEVRDNDSTEATSYLTLNFIVPDPNAPKIANIEGDRTVYESTFAELVDDGTDSVVTDLDNSGNVVDHLNNGYIRFNVTFSDGQYEVLDIESEGDGPGQIRRTDYEVFYEGVKIADIDPFEDGAGQALRLDFGDVTLEAIQALVRSLTYTDTFVLRSTEQRNLSLFIQDGDGLNRSYSMFIDVEDHPNKPTDGAPVVVNNNLSLENGDTLTISSDNIKFVDADNDASELTINVTNILNGQFEYIANAGTEITSFTQADIDNGLVQFVHDNNGLAPSYNLTASDGTNSFGPDAAATNFTSGSTSNVSVFENKIGVTIVDSSGVSGTPSYALAGVDAGDFDINPISGTLSFKNSPDFEVPSSSAGSNTYQVLVTVTGSDGGSEVLTYNINVKDVNEPPTISGTSPVSSLRAGDSYSFTPTASDPESATLDYSVSNNPSWLTINPVTGELSGTPTDADAGTSDNILITVSDGLNSATLDPISLTVIPNAKPIAEAQTIEVTEDESVDFSLVATDSDGTVVSYAIGTPANGTLTGIAPDLTYTPNAGFFGDDSFTYTVTDNDGGVSTISNISIIILEDLDGDGIPDINDPDDDNDGISDAVEGTTLDSDEDGIPNFRDTDSDGDGISDEDEGVIDTDNDELANYIDPDSDNDGISDEIEGTVDTDNDNTANYLDSDSDGDGISDADEGVGDPDSDNIANYLDTDSDGDGISDEDEGALDADEDNIPDYRDTDSDGDGISDEDEGVIDTDDDGIANYLDTDSDGDGIPDVTEGAIDTDEDNTPNYLDTDSDNDGILDETEGAIDTDEDNLANYIDPDSDDDGISDQDEGNIDSDEDGRANYIDTDSDNDGIPDEVEGVVDTDEDNTPNYLDTDSDNDGIPDASEGAIDTDEDEVPNYLDADSDGDGISDAEEGILDTDEDEKPNFLDTDSDGDGISDADEGVVDTDEDEVPNYLDTDSDNDGIPDETEGAIDTDLDNTPNYLDSDSDNDGISDADEGVIDTDEDSTPNYIDTDSDNDGISDADEGVIDTDEDSTPNYLDSDSDGDGISDADEGVIDTDEDSTPNYLDSDSDNDGISDADEGAIDTDLDNTPNYLDSDSDNDGISDADEGSLDSDQDGIPNYQESDSDNDGISDTDEGTLDSDQDGILDYQDTDSDNDGISDAEEGALDSDQDGILDYQDTDSDNDGISDADEGVLDTDNDGILDYKDTDSDNDGIPDADEGALDTDNDGILDYKDTDSDNDGIPDAEEGVLDTDQDGILDYKDTDSDNDGIPDVDEGVLDSDQDGILDYKDTDSDNDGIPDAEESALDTDNDGIPNYKDTDSDNDGIPDVDEGALDTDQDGISDYRDTDSDNDGIPDADEGISDTDNDGILDYKDNDSDNDGISDVDEGDLDSDQDGILDFLDTDSDNDGIPDADEGNLDSDQDGILDFRDTDSDNDGILDADEGTLDSDEDGIPNYKESDSDNDGIPDTDEGVLDSDNDGILDYQDTDSDNDGIPDADEGTLDSDNDGILDYKDTDSDNDGIPDADESALDSDQDGIPNYKDTDSDNDGISDADEGALDSDQDGILDYQDTDSDNDGIPDADESTLDSDNDGIPNYKDTDSDNDGISDKDEGALDSDNDGILDYQDTDSDNDGIPDIEEGVLDSDNDGVSDYFDKGADEDFDGIPDIIEGTGDIDNDGIPNHLDIDSDNDGLVDGFEANISGLDSDNDGIDDTFDIDQNSTSVDANNDGIVDTIQLLDTDNDGIANYVDVDSDGDFVPDALEATLGFMDLDSDNINDSYDVDYTLGIDEDQDGIDDRFDIDFVPGIDADGDGINDTRLRAYDHDQDGLADFIDIDSDNDGISDTVEANVTSEDTDGDGIYDGFDIDYNSGVDLNKDGIVDNILLIDTDGDSVFDMHDLDSDNDGWFDTQEAPVLDENIDGIADVGSQLNTLPDDSDGDGFANYRDVTSFGDGVFDISRNSQQSLDLDNDGSIDITFDLDRDGIDDSIDFLAGIHGSAVGSDYDNDGISNLLDLDDDNDGILDTVEGFLDSDNDGILNYLDRDSDNDGISDAFENNNVARSGIDANLNGVDDAWEDKAFRELIFALTDTDLDGIYDAIDTDSDNDGISDNKEQMNAIATNNDSDGDGIDDAFDVDFTKGIDIDLDGIDDRVLFNNDADNDGQLDYRDLDSDGDGISDADEGLVDTDGDGIPDSIDIDSDNDGIPDDIENGDFNNDGINDALQDNGKVETGVKGAGSMNLLAILGLIMISILRNRKKAGTLLLAALALTSTSAQAKDTCTLENATTQVGCWYVGAGVGLSHVDPEERKTTWQVEDNNDHSLKLLLGYGFTDHWFGEFSYEDMGSAQLYNLNPAITGKLIVDYSVMALNAGYWFYDEHSTWNVYLKGGLAYLETSTSEYVEQTHGSQITIGAGVQWRFADRWFSRLDITAYDLDAQTLNLSLGYYFGGTKTAAKKETSIMPAKAAPVALVPILEADSDMDGVSNKLDMCPATLEGAIVDETGCVVLNKITLNIQFDNGSDVISAEYLTQVLAVSEKLKQYKNPKLTVEGHTDWKGKQVKNQPLSERRALAVAKIIAEHTSIKETDMTVKGHGELLPIADNNTEEGRFKNRRVEIIIDNQ
ncbi:DUF4347 domain-containing protein [Pseudocolwellia sp. HL-MZ19]|uniref:DUF4347 domain-containing protein n=1 Tax=Pseudocolwellia sp. HL-MZ19 TaxID=3400846 RepID=UPI003CF7EDA3